MANIPIIDFARLGLSLKNEDDIKESDLFEVGLKLYEAFSTSGFAYLVNHGISSEVSDDLLKASEEFFSRPLEYKMGYYTKSPGVCYDPLGGVNSNLKRPFDYNEGIRFPAEPSEREWPDIPNLKKKTQSFQKMCETLILRILKALGHGSKLKDKNLFYKSHCLIGQKGNRTLLKLLHYPPITDDVKLEKNQLRIAEHSDFGSMTLLIQDAIGGLQIQTSDGDFAEVSYVPGSVLLNVGDMMQFWSGGRLKSTVHRVVIPNDPDKRRKSRRSIAYFSSVNNDVLLEELEFEDSSSNSARTGRAMTAEKYFTERLDALFFKI